MLYMMFLTFFVSLITLQAVCGECSYNPSNFSVTSYVPVNPLTNCLQYCRSIYDQTPQRAYYNVTSQNCQPVRFCNYTNNFYNYASNRCYNDEKFTVENASYIPETIIGGVIKIGANNGTQMVCVNGYYNIYKVGQIAICTCKLLWESSGRVDMNGFPFQCDVVTHQPDRHFYSSLKFDNATGKIISYGPFKANQMQVLLKNLRALQQQQEAQYVLNQSQPILYAVRTSLPEDPYIIASEYPILAIVLLVLLIVFIISYWEYDKLRIKVSGSKLKQKIKAALKQSNLIRQIN